MEKHLEEAKLLLGEKGLDGLFLLKMSSWNKGILICCPGDDYDELKSLEEYGCPGVFLALGEKKIHICFGHFNRFILETNDELSALFDEEQGTLKRIVYLTMEDDVFEEGDLAYLISSLAEKAREVGEKVYVDVTLKEEELDSFRKTFLDEYLDGAYVALRLAGVDAFTKKERVLLSKGEVLSFLKEKGVDLKGKYVSYAAYQAKKHEFWNNARADKIGSSWVLILNNQYEKLIQVLEVPGNAFETTATPEKGKILLRSDKPIYLDLHLRGLYLLDEKSDIPFCRFVARRFRY